VRDELRNIVGLIGREKKRNIERAGKTIQLQVERECEATQRE
jgi:hypothetical protein